jgi:hypothetical protein
VRRVIDVLAAEIPRRHRHRDVRLARMRQVQRFDSQPVGRRLPRIMLPPGQGLDQRRLAYPLLAHDHQLRRPLPYRPGPARAQESQHSLRARRHHISRRAHQGVVVEGEPGEVGQAAQRLRQHRQPVVVQVERGKGGQAAQRLRQRCQLVAVQAKVGEGGQAAQRLRQRRQLVAVQAKVGEGGQAAQRLRQRRQLVAVEVAPGEVGQAAQRLRQRRQAKYFQVQGVLASTVRLADATSSFIRAAAWRHQLPRFKSRRPARSLLRC